MNKDNETTGYTHPNLPREIIQKIKNMSEHRTLLQQKTHFSVDLPSPGGKRHRWHTKLKSLPFPHIIITEHHGRKITIHILHSDLGQCLTLKYSKEKWQRLASTPIEKIESIIPQRFRHDYLPKSQKKASDAQMGKIAEVLHTQRENLPAITPYNANLIISTRVLMPHLAKIRTLIDFWIAELSDAPGAQLLPFVEAHAI